MLSRTLDFQIRHCCHPGTTVVIGCPLGLALGANGSLFNFADHNCEWLPAEGALRQVLEATYFTDPTAAYFDGAAETPPGRLGWRWVKRAERAFHSAVAQPALSTALSGCV